MVMVGIASESISIQVTSVVTDPGSSKSIRQRLSPGTWYVSVECDTTVDAVLDETQEYFHYRGRTDVLNGASYEITMTARP